MKDYSAYVESTERFAEENYGVDRTDMRTLLACLLPSGNSLAAPPCWIIADSPKHAFWGHLSYALDKLGLDSVGATPQIRSLRPRYANAAWDSHLSNRDKPRIYMDYVFEEPPPYSPHPRNKWAEVEGECLRLRMRLSWMKTPKNGAEEELYQLLRRVIDVEHRPFLPLPIPKPPEQLIFALDLVMLANPALNNPPATLKNALILPTSHAVLMGRGKLEEQDHRILYRTLLSTIRPWTREILSTFADADTSLTMLDLQSRTGLKPKILIPECARLERAGVLDWGRRGKSARAGVRREWIGLDYRGKGMDMREFITGRVNWWE